MSFLFLLVVSFYHCWTNSHRTLRRMAISSPADYNAAVQVLPAGQDPFGAACDLSPDVQNFLFHYDLGQAEADLLVQEDLKSLKDVGLANPDGDSEEKLFFEWSIQAAVTSRKRQLLMRKCFQRMLRPQPYAAVVIGPPVASSSAAASSAAASSAAAPPAAAPPAAALDAGSVKKRPRVNLDSSSSGGRAATKASKSAPPKSSAARSKPSASAAEVSQILNKSLF